MIPRGIRRNAFTVILSAKKPRPDESRRGCEWVTAYRFSKSILNRAYSATMRWMGWSSALASD